MKENVKIVFAEDSKTISETVIKVLAGAGYTQVRHFPDGMTAYRFVDKVKIQAAEGQRPVTEVVDVLPSDIEMPQMYWLTLCRKVKSELNLPVPVIMFSALITDQMVQKCQAVGADAHISKSHIAELMAILGRLCSESQQAAEAA